MLLILSLISLLNEAFIAGGILGRAKDAVFDKFSQAKEAVFDKFSQAKEADFDKFSRKPEFDAIEINASDKAFITIYSQDSKESPSILIDHKYFTTDITNKVLYLTQIAPLEKETEIMISCKNFNRLKMIGNSSAKADTIFNMVGISRVEMELNGILNEDIEIELNGGSKFNFDSHFYPINEIDAFVSSRSFLNLNISKLSRLNARVEGNMNATKIINADLIVSGNASVNIHVTNNLKCKKIGNPDFHYTGNPSIINIINNNDDL